MGKITISPDDLVREIELDVGITLLTGTAYTQGMIVVKQDTGKYTNADVALSGAIAATPQMSYDQQTLYVLAADYDATGGDVAGVGYTGEFNANNVTLPGIQTLTALAGILQAKGIKLTDWRL
jgi:hypothetical protein